MRVMKALKDNLFGMYELHAQGRQNQKAAEQIAYALTHCIVVDEIVSAPKNGMIIKFVRAVEFKKKLEQTK